MTYSEKLRDPRWQKLRLMVMERDEFECRHCGDKKSTLHVHHLEYRKDPWDAIPDHLITLCEKCHESLESAVKFTKIACYDPWVVKCLFSIGEFVGTDGTKGLSQILNACNRIKGGFGILKDVAQSLNLHGEYQPSDYEIAHSRDTVE